VRSARYSGDHDDAANNAKLLEALATVDDAARTARFRCVLAFVDENERLSLADGACEGRIARAPRGSGGFGYDPLFLVGDGARTMAELAAGEKNAISHRGRAMQRMVESTLRAWARRIS
jgi:XTP/dITP diphosphohydrolase